MKALISTFATFLLLTWPHASIAAPGDEIYAHPGQLVSAGDGAKLNIYCMGQGSPTVVFDSGFEDWAPAWAAVQPRVAGFTRACSYDRAGAGFSTPGPMPRTSERIADELYAALHNAGISGPYILAGSAFGSYNIRAFADRHNAEVAGLVLVDGDATDLEPKALQASDRDGRDGLVVFLGQCRDAITAGKPLPPLSRHGLPGSDCSQQFFRGLPSDDWSPALNDVLLHVARGATQPCTRPTCPR